MIGTEASGVARCDEASVLSASAAAKCLSFAAAPTFAIMAMLTVGFSSGAPSVLCSAVSSSTLDGMAPMYLLMAAFHLGPWLRLFSQPSLRANGSRECAPDDRLREAIQ